MSWDTDLTNAISETVSEIQSLDSKISVIADSNTATLPAVNSSTVNANFWKVLAYGVSGSSATAITLSVNGTQIASAPIGNSQVFMFEAHFFFDSSNGNIPIQPVSPVGGSFSRANISGSPSTLTFSLGGTASVDSFWLQPA